jgi:hypothetical protein
VLLGAAGLLVSSWVEAQIVNPVPSPTDSARAVQAVESSTDDKKVFANPSVLGMGPSKGVVVRYERAPQFGVTSQSDASLIGNGAAQIRRLNVNEIKAYAPLWNHPHLKFVLGFNYARQQFNFADPGHLDYAFYKVLEDRNLKTVGTQLLMLRPIDGRKYFLFRVKGELNGDYAQDAEDGKYRRLPLRKYLRTSAEFFYGWKRSPRQSLAIGAQFGYTFGRRSIYPAIIYNRTWNDHWGVEAIFPARARARYNLNEKTLFYGGYEVQGDSYTINVNVPPAVGDLRTMELRVTALNTRLRVEREVFPIMWVAFEAGWRYYASFSAYDSSADRNKVIDNTLKNSAVFSAEVFLTPPRRFLKQ